VAFESDESGRWEVFVAAFPDFTSKQHVSSGGGVQPQWRALPGFTSKRRNLLSLAQRPRIAEFDGVTIPVFTLPCGVHRSDAIVAC
jgi:hypothetical protein